MKTLALHFASVLVLLSSIASAHASSDSAGGSPAEQFASLTKEYDDQVGEFNDPRRYSHALKWLKHHTERRERCISPQRR
jgi:hypothetical protein